MHNLVLSPVFDPSMSLEAMLSLAGEIGFHKYEAMTTWTTAAFDPAKGADHYIALGEQCGIKFTSLHVPPVKTEDPDGTLQMAIEYAQFARAVGFDIVIFRASERALYGTHTAPFLDAVEPLGLTTVVTNHAGSPISNLDDYHDVLEAVADDRLRALFEVGHFFKAGVDWEEALDALSSRIALVHIKEMRGGQAVAPYGKGDVPFARLFERLALRGYQGNFVVELEKIPTEQAATLLKRSVAHLCEVIPALSNSEPSA